MGASVLAKGSGRSPNLQQLKYNLREQAHSHKGCVRHAIHGGLRSRAREDVGTAAKYSAAEIQLS